MEKWLVLIVLSGYMLMSCGKTNKLSQKDFLWMPYNGTETLVFKSNTGDTDTIFLLKKDTMLAYPEAQALNGIKFEIVGISCKHIDPNIRTGKHRYLQNSFLSIEKAKDNRSEIDVNLLTKDAVFYRLRPIKIDSLDKTKAITFKTSYDQYNDVYIINAEDYLGGFHKRSNYVPKLYWSKSKGLIRYDKKDGIYWELAEKF